MPGTRMAIAGLCVLSVALAISNVMLWGRLGDLSQPPRALANAKANPPQTVSALQPSEQAAGASASAAPSDTEEHADLAPFMGRLQTMTHKLGLALSSNNPKLAEFYLYEARETVSEIREAVPEYRGYPVAVLIDRMLGSAQQALADLLQKGADQPSLMAGYARVTRACNGCHEVTKHPFIHIPDASPSLNPYLQIFGPEKNNASNDAK